MAWYHNLNLKQLGQHMAAVSTDPDEAMTGPRLRTDLRTPDYIKDTRVLLEQERRV